MNMSGCKSEMLDKISLDMTNISEQISLYLSKIEDELDNLFEEVSRATGSVKAYN